MLSVGFPIFNQCLHFHRCRFEVFGNYQSYMVFFVPQLDYGAIALYNISEHVQRRPLRAVKLRHTPLAKEYVHMSTMG